MHFFWLPKSYKMMIGPISDCNTCSCYHPIVSIYKMILFSLHYSHLHQCSSLPVVIVNMVVQECFQRMTTFMEVSLMHPLNFPTIFSKMAVLQSHYGFWGSNLEKEMFTQAKYLDPINRSKKSDCSPWLLACNSRGHFGGQQIWKRLNPDKTLQQGKS